MTNEQQQMTTHPRLDDWADRADAQYEAYVNDARYEAWLRDQKADDDRYDEAWLPLTQFGPWRKSGAVSHMPFLAA